MVTNVKVRAPSSTANLGPGFDVFGLALDAFYDEITLSKTNKSITTNRPWHGVRILTTDDVPKDPQQNTAGLVVKAMKQKFKIKSGIEIRIKKGVPAGELRLELRKVFQLDLEWEAVLLRLQQLR